ncbi:MAG: hypothetical protein H0V87_03135 [Chloroflexi bacterium]|nr:hypothetical protein [Chloroflexota bacterium]
MTDPLARTMPPGLELVSSRRFIEPTVDAWLPLRPGDRPRVTAGQSVVPGIPLADRLRDARLIDVPARPGGKPGDRWSAAPAARGGEGSRSPHPEGEILFETGGRWRIAIGEQHEAVHSPIEGIVREVRPGVGLVIRSAGSALWGVLALGDAARGRLEIATGADGELRPRSLDVGSAGAILVVGARIDAEALTRARAMGIRGVIVATLPGKDRRDYLASEARQRSSLHQVPAFGVLVLHGSQRRPIAEGAMRLLERLAGREVAIVGTPPALVFDPQGVPPEVDPPDMIHVRSGPLAGRRGQWAGFAGLRRFSGGTHLEAALVRFGEDAPIAMPIGDLERLT